MAGKLNTFSGRMILVLLLIHAALLPVLYYGVLLVVENSQKDAFIDGARIYARVFVDILESDSSNSDAEIVRHLDSAILGGRGVHAAMLVGGRLLTSSLLQLGDADLFKEDFAFGENGDSVYYLSIPVAGKLPDAVLRLGFDEAPTLRSFDEVRRIIIYILLFYVSLSLLMASILAAQLVKPIHRLQQVSREIASGDYAIQLSDKTHLSEITELASDLEIMRSRLVGANARLLEVIEEREDSQREQKLLEARLRHSHRLESIGTLAGGVAHEFNNVLAPIILYTDLALEDIEKDSPLRPNLQRIMSLAQRAKGLSHQILSFSSQAGEVERVAVDIAPVIEEGLSLVRALVPATIDIRAKIPHNLGLVLCDPAQIQQLVVNLCSNAFRSLSMGGGEIRVSVDRKSVSANKQLNLPDGEYVTLSVSDTGTGMDAETKKRIFEPFFTTREVGQGAGLGLSVVHGIVVKHDGDILVSSTPGRGSMFRVYFPLAGRQSLNSERESGK